MSNPDGAPEPTTTQEEVDFETVKAELEEAEEAIEEAMSRRKAKAAQGIVVLERKRETIVMNISELQGKVSDLEKERAIIEAQLVGLREIVNGDPKKSGRDIGVGDWIREFMRRAVEWNMDMAIAEILKERHETKTDTARRTINNMVCDGLLIAEGPRSNRTYTSREIALELGKISEERGKSPCNVPKPPDAPESDDEDETSGGSSDAAVAPQEADKASKSYYTGPLTQRQLNAIRAIAVSIGWTRDLILETIKEMFDKDEVERLTKEEARQFIGELQQKMVKLDDDAKTPKPPKPTPTPTPTPTKPMTAEQYQALVVQRDRQGLSAEDMERRCKQLFGFLMSKLTFSDARFFIEVLHDEADIRRIGGSVGHTLDTEIETVKEALLAFIGDDDTKKMTRKEEEWHRSELSIGQSHWAIALMSLRERNAIFTARRSDRSLLVARSDTQAAAADVHIDESPLFPDTEVPDHA